jgi:hypothetical protein
MTNSFSVEMGRGTLDVPNLLAAHVGGGSSSSGSFRFQGRAHMLRGVRGAGC